MGRRGWWVTGHGTRGRGDPEACPTRDGPYRRGTRTEETFESRNVVRPTHWDLLTTTEIWRQRCFTSIECTDEGSDATLTLLQYKNFGTPVIDHNQTLLPPKVNSPTLLPSPG